MPIKRTKTPKDTAEGKKVFVPLHINLDQTYRVTFRCHSTDYVELIEGLQGLATIEEEEIKV